MGTLVAACSPGVPREDVKAPSSGTEPASQEPPSGRLPDAVAWARALQTGACEVVHDTALRDSCLVALVERRGVDRCAEVVSPTTREECAFRLAEKLRAPERCKEAGRFAEDCALHVVSNTFLVDAPDARPGGPEESVLAARIVASGLAADDPRAWTAWYRWALGRHAPLDRGSCDAVTNDTRRALCRTAGRGLYEDRLRHARDTGALTCEVHAESLQHTPDPELDTLRASLAPACDTPEGTRR